MTLNMLDQTLKGVHMDNEILIMTLNMSDQTLKGVHMDRVCLFIE